MLLEGEDSERRFNFDARIFLCTSCTIWSEMITFTWDKSRYHLAACLALQHELLISVEYESRFNEIVSFPNLLSLNEVETVVKCI